MKVTTKQQFERMIQLMKDNPEIGRGARQIGSSKNAITVKWKQFAAELNGLGPPKRTPAEWKRVWIHYKAKVKRKIANRQSVLGPTQDVPLSGLEESVTRLVNMSPATASVSDIGVEKVEPADSSDDLTSDSDSSDVLLISPPTSRRRKKKNKLDVQHAEIFKEQALTQKQLLKTLSKINKTLREMKENEITFNAQRTKQKMELHRLKLKYLKLKIAKLEMDD